MWKRNLILWLFFIVISFNAIGQKFEPGYVININNDTIRGYVKDLLDRDLRLKVEFKKEKNSEVQQLGASMITGFGFDYGRTFNRFSFKDTETKSKDSITFFAKKILDGRITAFTSDIPESNQSDIVMRNNASKIQVRMTGERNDLEPAENQTQSRINLGLLKVVTDGLINPTQKSVRSKYHDKAMLNQVVDYNKRFQSEYPTFKYKPRVSFSHNVSVGYQFQLHPDESGFRVEYFRNKNLTEKTRTYSFMQGITYRYWSGKISNQDQVRTTQQFLSIIPIGVNVHTDWKVVNFFGYIGAGLTLLAEKNHPLTTNADQDREDGFTILPSAVAGAGIKIKIRSNSLIMHVTPTGDGSGLFFNVGYSF